MGEGIPSHWWVVSAVELFILGSAAWRITNLLVNEDGPFFVLARFRYWLGVRFDENSNPFGTNIVAEMVSCVYCASVWISLLVVGSFLLWRTTTLYVLLLFSISTLTIMIDRMVNHE